MTRRLFTKRHLHLCLPLILMLSAACGDAAATSTRRNAEPIGDPASDEQTQDGSVAPEASMPGPGPTPKPGPVGLADAGALPSTDAGADASLGPGGSTCPAALEGWATVAGDNVATTTGGSAGDTVRPTSVAELLAAASDAAPRVIEIEGTFEVPRLQINSNKTLVGVGRDAAIHGGLRIRGRADAPVSNVIVRNLRVDGATSAVDGDAVQVFFAHHVWIDHCEIFDGPDGNLDVTHAANWITVSWTKFLYTANYQKPEGEPSDHRFSSLLGNSDDNGKEDAGRLKVTFHHNWWADRVIERMPRVRFGQVHVANNYFSSQGNNYCVRAGTGARLLIEANYFDAVKSPHEFNSEADERTAHITARDNVYFNTTGNQQTDGDGEPFANAPYALALDPVDSLAALVTTCAGPR